LLAKIWWLPLPLLVFCSSGFFGLIHHFYRFAWAGTLFYYTLILLIVVIFAECLLVVFQ
jgi:uncharacterized membrane protein